MSGERNCGNCGHGYPFTVPADDYLRTPARDEVECRRHPPTIVSFKYSTGQGRPRLSPDNWCGEWTSNEEGE